jgi:AsmA protein
MKLAGFDTDIEGQHNMDGSMNYVLKMAIPPFDIVKIPLHVNGTYDKPKIHLGKGHEDSFKKITSAN